MQKVNSNRRIVIIIFYLFVQIVVASLLSKIFLNSQSKLDLIKMLWLNLGLGIISIIGLVFIAYKKLSVDALTIKKHFKDIIKYFLLAIAVMIVTSFLVQQFMGNRLPVNQAVLLLLYRAYPLPIIVLTIFFAPIIEELVFRLGIINLETTKGKWFSIILSSFIFGIVHLQIMDIYAFINEFGFILIYASLGFVLALSYVKTENILVSIGVHALYNLFSILLITL